MKPREHILVRRLLLNQSYNDYLIAETTLIGIDRDILKTLSRYPNVAIANEAMKLRIDCMELFSDLCHSYKKMYENLIENTMEACTGPKPDEDSPLFILDPVTLLPYRRKAYSRAKVFEKKSKRISRKTKSQTILSRKRKY